MDPMSELPDGIARALKALDADAARREGFRVVPARGS